MNIAVLRKRGRGSASSNVRTSIARVQEILGASSSKRRTVIVRMVVVLLAFACLAIVDRVGGAMHYEQRQRQLLNDYYDRRTFINPGDAIAILQAADIGLSTVVVEGVRPGDLRAGPGHWSGTAEPGQEGASVILGHHSRMGGPFSSLDKLVEGNQIVVQRRSASPRTYVVATVGSMSVTEALALPEGSDSTLVLVTSTSSKPWADSYVVVAKSVDSLAQPNLPVTGASPQIPASFEPFDAPLLNRDLVTTLAWMGIAWLAYAWMRDRYKSVTRWIVISPMLATAVVALWFAVDRLLPAGA
jgi:LPXTG-site transpeptidase (sortase) family protein